MKLAATEYRDAGEILSMTRMSRASWTLEQDDQACTSVKSVYTTGRETFTTIVEVSRREDGSILVNQTDIVIDGIGVQTAVGTIGRGDPGEQVHAFKEWARAL